ncbi:MAG TPA: hypothetical protein VFD36_10425 [Kofleriaceae bacterium]|nr:hypothetical protein [Kofleriaceae bacterium]
MTDTQRRGLLASILGRLPSTTPGEMRVLDLVLERLEHARLEPPRRSQSYEDDLCDSLIRSVQGCLAERERQRAELHEQARAEMVGGPWDVSDVGGEG